MVWMLIVPREYGTVTDRSRDRSIIMPYGRDTQARWYETWKYPSQSTCLPKTVEMVPLPPPNKKGKEKANSGSSLSSGFSDILDGFSDDEDPEPEPIPKHRAERERHGWTLMV